MESKQKKKFKRIIFTFKQSKIKKVLQWKKLLNLMTQLNLLLNGTNII